MEILAIFGCLGCFLAGGAVALATQRFSGSGAFREKKAQARLRVILQNVEAYDGTGAGQKELPGM